MLVNAMSMSVSSSGSYRSPGPHPTEEHANPSRIYTAARAPKAGASIHPGRDPDHGGWTPYPGSIFGRELPGI